MPGLAGFTRDAVRDQEPLGVLGAMRALLTHADYYVQDTLWCDESVCGTRPVTGVIHREPQPHRQDDVAIWLDGSIYNGAEVAAAHGFQADDELTVLAGLYQRNPTLDFLKKLDGFFSAVIYDIRRKLLHLVTDRYGLRYLYWSQHNGGLVWGGEAKVVFALPDFQPVVNQQAVNQFVQLGYLLEDSSLLDGVQLVPSGSVMTWNLVERSLRQTRYWWWDAMPPLDLAVKAQNAAELLYDHFRQAVARASTQSIVNLELSGGLDSRAVFAAIPEGRDLHTFTIGQVGCDDIRIAAQVSQLRDARHHVLELHGETWINERALAEIWEQDGQVSLAQIIGSSPNFPNPLDDALRLNGFAGDLVIGGSYLQRHALDTDITVEIAVAKMKCASDLIANLEHYRGLGKTDYYFMQNRVRRFTMGGIRRQLTRGEVQMPFMDNTLLETIYRLPDWMRYESYVYRLMLLTYYPNYYRHIPWQKSGATINTGNPFAPGINYRRKVERLSKKYRRKLGLIQPTAATKGHADRAKWIRAEPSRLIFERVLTDPDALYPDYVSRDQVIQDWEHHFTGVDRSNALCHVFTLEIWLQKVFTGRHRLPSRTS